MNSDAARGRGPVDRSLDIFFDLAPGMMIEAGFDGYFGRVNPAFVALSGYIEDELLSTPFMEFVWPEDRPEFAAQFGRMMAGEDVRDFEFRVLLKNGDYRWFLSHTRVVGERMYAFAVDLTDRKRAEEVAQAAREQADRANRAKTEFLARMSHELRTPLNAVLGFAQLLALDALQPRQREAVDQIHRAGELLLRLIDEVLDISRIEADRLSISLEPIHVGTLIDDCLQLVYPMAAEQAIGVAPPPRKDGDVYAIADQQRLKQALLNLLSNAVKYNRQPGRVWLTVGVEDRRVVISVADTGRGIDPASIDRLFTPFERLGAEGSEIPGTGLGLALSRRLVELMRGTITVESELGKGSAFHISLERAERPADEGAPVPDRDSGTQAIATEPDRGAGILPLTTVLYVEDNLANLRLVEQVLARVGNVEVIPAMQGKLGLELARTHRPDLILLDLHLPDMTGEDITAALRADDDTRDIPIVILTASAHSSQRRELLDLGVNAYLTKPFDVTELIDLVEQAVGGQAPSAPR